MSLDPHLQNQLDRIQNSIGAMTVTLKGKPPIPPGQEKKKRFFDVFYFSDFYFSVHYFK